jgi:hypothetical protein
MIYDNAHIDLDALIVIPEFQLVAESNSERNCILYREPPSINQTSRSATPDFSRSHAD